MPADFSLTSVLNQQIQNLYNQVKDLQSHNITEILKVNAMVERMLVQYRDNPQLLILQTRLSILGSQEQRARAMAARVWEIGGDINLLYEKMYLDDLLNLGLLDMALILIKPRFENMNENIKLFPLEMTKFAIMTGSVPLLNRIAAYNPEQDLFKAIKQFTNTYTQNKYEEHFKNIQKIVLESFGNEMCAYDYNVYTDRGFTDIEISVYFSNYATELSRYASLLESKISGYCLMVGAKRINNLSFVMKNIKDHPKF